MAASHSASSVLLCILEDLQCRKGRRLPLAGAGARLSIQVSAAAGAKALALRAAHSLLGKGKEKLLADDAVEIDGHAVEVLRI